MSEKMSEKVSDKTGKVSDKTEKMSEKVSDKTVEKTRVKNKKTRVKTEKTRVENEKTREKIIALIKENNNITSFELAEALSITQKGVEWHLKQLKDKNIIRRIGGKKGGHWEIVQGAENE